MRLTQTSAEVSGMFVWETEACLLCLLSVIRRGCPASREVRFQMPVLQKEAWTTRSQSVSYLHSRAIAMKTLTLERLGWGVGINTLHTFCWEPKAPKTCHMSWHVGGRAPAWVTVTSPGCGPEGKKRFDLGKSTFSLFFFKLRVYEWARAVVLTGSHRVQKNGWDVMGLELPAAGSLLNWALGSEISSSARAAGAEPFLQPQQFSSVPTQKMLMARCQIVP